MRRKPRKPPGAGAPLGLYTGLRKRACCAGPRLRGDYEEKLRSPPGEKNGPCLTREALVFFVVTLQELGPGVQGYVDDALSSRVWNTETVEAV
jgi:hypothetical protein